MKQSELKRKSPLQRGAGPQRKSTPKRSQPRRYWKDARAKVADERVCRRHPLGDCQGPVEAAHVLGREHDSEWVDSLFVDYLHPGYDLYVEPVRVVPMCRKHHRAYDAHQIDVLSALTLEEQLQAVKDAGGIESARVRTCPTLYGTSG